MTRFNAKGKDEKCSYRRKICQTFQIYPKVVRVKDFELADCEDVTKTSIEMTDLRTGFEVFNMLRRYLSNFKKSNSAFIVNESTTLCVYREKDIKSQIGERIYSP